MTPRPKKRNKESPIRRSTRLRNNQKRQGNHPAASTAAASLRSPRRPPATRSRKGAAAAAPKNNSANTTISRTNWATRSNNIPSTRASQGNTSTSTSSSSHRGKQASHRAASSKKAADARAYSQGKKTSTSRRRAKSSSGRASSKNVQQKADATTKAPKGKKVCSTASSKKVVIPTAKNPLSPISYTAPETMKPADPSKAFRAVEDLCSIPESITCSVCFDPLRGGTVDDDASPVVVALAVCGHRFHRECIESGLQHAKKCPICRKCIDEPVGMMPSGTMTMNKIAHACGGYDGAGSIQIHYQLRGGTQKAYHENPGATYYGDARTAYLPDNDEGRNLLKRLRYAFSHGLTFTVGTSLTTGRPNAIVWSSIHHKTSLCGGLHGFPDPGYFLNCNEDLDALGVPPADDCRE